NLFISKRRERGETTLVIKVLDLGAVKVITDRRSPTSLFGQMVATPAYMSPEQFANEPATARSDQYALGVILYEMVMGRRIFGQHHVGDILPVHWAMWHATARLIPFHDEDPSLPDYLWPLAERMLQKRPEERFASLIEVVEATAGVMARYLDDETR